MTDRDTLLVVRLDKLPAMLKARRKLKRVSVRDAAFEANTSPSTLSRVENGTTPDAEAFLKLSAWVLR